jgi:hypothetical protein
MKETDGRVEAALPAAEGTQNTIQNNPAGQSPKNAGTEAIDVERRDVADMLAARLGRRTVVRWTGMHTAFGWR